MSAFKSDNIRRFCEKYLVQDGSENAGEPSWDAPPVLDFEVGNEKLETYALIVEALNQIESSVAGAKNTSDSNKFQIYEHLSNVRFLVWELMSTFREAMKEADVSANGYLSKMSENLVKMVDQATKLKINEKTYEELCSEYDVPGVSRQKSMIIKNKGIVKFVKSIKPLVLNYPIQTFTRMEGNKILITFKRAEDCIEFKHEVEKRYPKAKIYVEDDEGAEILIYNVGDITPRNLEIEIEKITHEKPNVVRILEVERGETWSAHVELSSLAYLKLQAHNDSTIAIGNVRSYYKHIVEWVSYREYHPMNPA